MTLKKLDGFILFSELTLAKTFWQRTVGLLKHKSLTQDQAMWIIKCNAIHTLFMKFTIDCVFVDKKGLVKKVYHNVRPWRYAGPVWGATDVIEMAAGQAKAKNIVEGDVIQCGL